MNLPALTCIHAAALVVAIALSAGIAQAQPSGATANAPGERPAPVRTGKERLGNKWSDEQRVDDCKVPPDKRGTKARPAACPWDLTH